MIKIAQPIIANPMYDTVFKRLMENERIVRTFIGTILGKTVEKLSIGHGKVEWLEPQDEIIAMQANKDNAPQVRWKRDFDFTALVKTGKTDDACEEMPIRVRKFGPYSRARNYREKLVDRNENESAVTSICILGFTLPDIESACARIGKTAEDLVEAKPLTATNKIVESLMNNERDTYVIQPERIVAGNSRTELDKLLGIFEQRDFFAINWDENKILKRYSHSVDNEDLREIVDFLHYLAAEPDERKLIEYEYEYWFAVSVQIEAMREEKDREIAAKDREIAAKDREIAARKEIIKELNEAILYAKQSVYK
jgi:hypothetical protein